ncbi:MAG: chorismate mutase [Burkholderiaceae bacterium]
MSNRAIPRRPAPRQCVSIDEVRREIDQIDQAIVRALGERFEYAKRGAELKKIHPPVAVPGEDRLTAMIERRRAWATEAGLSPDAIEAMFRQLVAYFLAEEARHVADDER